jgi:hypothetical protein
LYSIGNVLATKSAVDIDPAITATLFIASACPHSPPLPRNGRVVMGGSIHPHRCAGLDQTLAKPCGDCEVDAGSEVPPAT